MRKTIQISIISFSLLAVALIFFNRAYRELTNYSELTNRHNSIRNGFQNLSQQLKNAAILTPDLAKASDSTRAGKLFFTDSFTIFKQLGLLKSTVVDSVNIQIVKKLDILIKSEVSWLIKSNMPDSIIDHKSLAHIAAFQSIDSLINEGIQRTTFLIEYGKNDLDEEIKKLREWMALFIILSGALLIYTTVSLSSQKIKRKRKEEELAIVLNRINDGIVSVDNEWRYTFLNDAAMATHPLSKEETLGKVIWDVHPEMEGTIFWDKYHEAMHTRKVVEVESYYAPMNIWFSVKVYPSADGLTIFYKDFTERKKLEERQELFASIINSSDDAILSKTLDGIITSWNPGAEKIFGYSSDEIIGKHISVLIPSYLQNEENKIIQKIQHGKTIDHYETERIRKDGEIINVSLTISPIKDSFGNIVGASKISRDITDRKEAEEKLIKSEKIYKTIASSIPGSIICLIDTEYRYLLIEGDMFVKLGYSKDQLLGNKAEDVLSPEVFASIKNEFEKALGGETITREINRNGYDIISTFIPLKDENNAVYSIMLLATDVTELKKVQHDIAELNRGLEEKIIKRTEELKKSNDELESFSYSVSHDLRAPLRAVNGYAKILEEDYDKVFDAEGKRLLGEVQNNATKMGILIDDLLAFSRLGRKEVEKSLIDMNKLTELAIWEINQTTEHHAEIKFCNLLPAEADPALLKHVMINLISNAIKYSSKKEKPVIEIKSKQEDSKLIYSINDNGAGFNMQYAHKLFGVFQRLHSADEFSGTGVGLAIVDRIINKHNGKVWAEGQTDNGATFYFSLPVN
jgi:PAS domain S-box-containing protein